MPVPRNHDPRRNLTANKKTTDHIDTSVPLGNLSSAQTRPITDIGTGRILGYAAAPGATYSDADAQIIGAELETIAAQEIAVTPQEIVARAKRASSVLHKFFEWDNRKAAEAHRIHQARNLVNHLQIRVETPNGEIAVKAQFNVRMTLMPISDSSGGQVTHTVAGRVSMGNAYVSIGIAQGNAEYWNQIRDGAYRELLAWRAKYGALGFAEFAPIYKVVDTFALLPPVATPPAPIAGDESGSASAASTVSARAASGRRKPGNSSTTSIPMN